MKNYEAGTPSYFATRESHLVWYWITRHSSVFPTSAPVQLIYALETSLKTIMEGKVSLEERFQMHRDASQKFKKEMQGLGFKTVSVHPFSLEDCSRLDAGIFVSRDFSKRHDSRILPGRIQSAGYSTQIACVRISSLILTLHHAHSGRTDIARISSLRLVCTRTSRTSTSEWDTWVSPLLTRNVETSTRSSRASRRLSQRPDTRVLEMRSARLTLRVGKRASAWSQSCKAHRESYYSMCEWRHL